MDLRQTLILTHTILKQNNIPHAMIGGMALACYGIFRATMDLDILIHEEDQNIVKEILNKNSFNLINETNEFMQFSGIGNLDVLIARRPLSKDMLTHANLNGPEGIPFVRLEDLIGLKIQAYKNDPSRALQDKADIQELLKSKTNYDISKIKSYADLFNAWEEIKELMNDN